MPFPTPGNLPNPGIELAFLEYPSLADGFFTTTATLETSDSTLKYESIIEVI